MMLVSLLSGFAAVLVVPAALLCVQALAALMSGRGRVPDAGSAANRPTRPRFAVLVPAHDERAGIVSTVQDLLPQLGPDDRLLVVADNCSDDTAALAAAAGAQVIERTDPARRGKGYALDFGLRHLSRMPPDVVIVIDADCRVAAGSLDRLAHAALARRRPVQAHYAMLAEPGARFDRQIAAFAWLVKNLVRPLGMARLGLPCQLMGTGMAFPWPLIARQQLASGELVEDLKLGLDCAVAGAAALFAPDVVVQSRFAQSEGGLRSQRSRWEHGHLSLILGQFPRLLVAGLRQRRLAPIALALDLAVPPLALLSLLVGAGIVLAGSAWIVLDTVLPLQLASTAGSLLAAAVLVAWRGFGRQTVSARTLAMAPLYALGKIGVYASFVRRRQRAWIRTDRDHG